MPTRPGTYGTRDRLQQKATTKELMVYDSQTATLYSQIRWGIVREPTWTDGAESTAPGAGDALVTKTVTAAKTGRVFGVHITAGEANEFRLYSGASIIKRFSLGLAGTIHIVLGTPLLDDVAAATAITIKVVNAAGAGIVYQASLLYDEA